jgi:hypothetical protein
MRAASSSRCLPKVQWLFTKKHCPFPDDITEVAAGAGDVEMLRWLRTQCCWYDEKTTLRGAELAGNLHVLQFLYEGGCHWHADVCGVAGKAGDLNQLKWLHEHGATVSTSTAILAAEGGAVPVFEYLQQQQGVRLHEEMMFCAAERGHLQLCQWLHSSALGTSLLPSLQRGTSTVQHCAG